MTVEKAKPREFGRYRIVGVLGAGAMGTVYRARDTQLDRDVAIKVPKLEADHAEAVIQRFYREARTAAQLRHRNLCPIYDVGCIDGQHFISMALIEGRPLSDFISAERESNPKTCATLVRRLASAIAEAHRHGIVHRDLKPDNIMIDSAKEPIVMDFGLARSEDEATRVTQSGMLVGTPAYMSPEQVRGDTESIGPATDIYALGVILYEMLTADIPFRGSLAQVVYQITAANSDARVSQVRADIDPVLEGVCARMMAKRPQDRFASMEEVVAALDAYLKNVAGQNHSHGRPLTPDVQRRAIVATGTTACLIGLFIVLWAFSSPATRRPAEEESHRKTTSQQDTGAATTNEGNADDTLDNQDDSGDQVSVTPKPSGATLKPGLARYHFARLSHQRGHQVNAHPADLLPPVRGPDVVTSIRNWTYDSPLNSAAVGYLQIDEPGVHRFKTYNYYDQNSLFVDGRLVCPYRGSVPGGSDPKGEEVIQLECGLVPIVILGFVNSRGSVEVTWEPPMGGRIEEIPPTLLFHDPAHPLKPMKTVTR